MGLRHRLGLTAVLITFAACHDGGGEPGGATGAPPDAEVIVRGADGLPTFVGGDLGHAPRDLLADDAEVVMAPILERIAPLFGGRADELRFAALDTDDIGYRHLHYRQEVDGLEVVGGELDLHIDHRGVVYLANGSARAIAIPSSPSVSLAEAQAALAAHRDFRGLALDSSRLVYLVASGDQSLHLAWEIGARGARGGDPVRDLAYVDAHGGGLVDVHPQIHPARNRATHNLFNGTTLPGTLQRSEGQGPVADVDVNFAHDFAGDTYDCYLALFGRDSFDGAGGQITSSVHYSSNYVNAFWNGSQMVYGDGDGVNSGPLDRALDVVSHELTHAVTQHEAGLVYQNEPGALNEANSAIFAAVCEQWKDGAISADTWKVGEDVWTPGIAGDALRYMDNPTLDGASRDYYPQRYTGQQDNGGVHWNSGIPNLAFYLLVNGGQHPRNMTPGVTVAGLGIEVASQVWYRAATIYFQYTSTMSAARAATYQAAVDLFPTDPSVRQSVEDAWAAVGVAAPAAPPATVMLASGVPVGGISGPPDRTYAIDVPAGATSVTFTISGPNGDADLYGKFGTVPSNNDSEARSESAASNETITIQTDGRIGLYYAQVKAFSSYNNLSIVASFATGAPPSAELQNGVTRTELAGSAGSRTPFVFVVPTGATSVSFSTAGGPGNADLYVRKDAPPDIGDGQWDFRSNGSDNTEAIATGTNAPGTWYVLVYGTTAFNALSLTARHISLYGRTWRDLAGEAGTKIRKSFKVVPGTTRLTLRITGGSGDADLYVRFGAKPTLARWDYRPYLEGNEETVVVNNPPVGTWYLMVNGKTAFSGVTMTARGR
ncbi:MAG TPA: M4 family metallopeptidase [Kofleriaceae bacterium]|nr:M4 family metallopeptidase [Kofleriaceae bacterium]